MVAASSSPRKSSRVTKATLAAENAHLRRLLASAIDITLDATDFVELGDVPEDPDAFVEVPFGMMESLRDAVRLYARQIGLDTEAA